jgi:glucuronate isomerase
MINKDFLLKNKIAKRLYHDCAAALPVIDYHNHLSPSDIAEDRCFENLTELWVAHDPYKHRAMRIAGVPEALITGDCDPRTKFDSWAASFEKTAGGPLYHWSALELKRFFGIDKQLSSETADFIWEEVNEKLASPEYSAQSFLRKCNVETLCTSDLILDDLKNHREMQSSSMKATVLPSLRGDDILAVDSPGYLPWLKQLGERGRQSVNSYEDFCTALSVRLVDMDLCGCKLADHALDRFEYAAVTSSETATLFAKRLKSEALTDNEIVKLKSGILLWLAANYQMRGWTMQLHIGAQRYTSSRLRKLAGASGGYAAAGSCCDISMLCTFLDYLESRDALPNTILYTLNPEDSAAFAILTGSYAEDGVQGKIQFGPAWWYNDHIMGMRNHFETLANYGLLSSFIGMTTDSRSLLSLSRHEYFRRILCWRERLRKFVILNQKSTDLGVRG